MKPPPCTTGLPRSWSCVCVFLSETPPPRTITITIRSRSPRKVRQRRRRGQISSEATPRGGAREGWEDGGGRGWGEWAGEDEEDLGGPTEGREGREDAENLGGPSRAEKDWGRTKEDLGGPRIWEDPGGWGGPGEDLGGLGRISEDQRGWHCRQELRCRGGQGWEGAGVREQKGS